MSILHAKVIVNPVAGARTTYRKWARISSLLKHVGLSFDYEYTESVGHAVELARLAASDVYRYIVSVGGDGTANEVANGILHSTHPSETSLGIVNTGTGRDFARSLGLPQDYASACAVLNSSNRRLVDVGIVKFNCNGQSQQRFFINMAGVGFDAAAVETTEKLPKHLGGTIPYLTGLLLTMLRYKNKTVVINMDDRIVTKRVLNVVIANGSYVGGGMHVAPQAKLNDSLLDVVTIGDIGKFELLKALPMVYKGTHVNHPRVSIEQVKNIAIESSERLQVYADGELLGECPASFSLKPAALSIVV
ncbi:MAG: diacylglycerol kinase family lipid kinase [Dehalococcoidales bacterium]|nr:diacylglycerol kinase family lipid kinase [Dehalococcoidales bacterium]